MLADGSKKMAKIASEREKRIMNKKWPLPDLCADNPGEEKSNPGKTSGSGKAEQ
tara:strand:+ start:138 stop:299 length:162 start_codon:yes stop_codon:yes gene_type:complete